MTDNSDPGDEQRDSIPQWGQSPLTRLLHGMTYARYIKGWLAQIGVEAEVSYSWDGDLKIVVTIKPPPPLERITLLESTLKWY